MSISTNIAYSIICKLSLLCHNSVIKLVKLILDLDQYIIYNYTIHFSEYFLQSNTTNVVLFKKTEFEFNTCENYNYLNLDISR